MKFKILAFFHFCFLLCIALKGQENPTFYQYWYNPSWYNPSYIGNSGYNEFFLSHRIQWAGIQDAPSTSAVGFHLPMHPSYSLGISVQNHSSIHLNNFNLLLGGAYIVRIDNNQNLNFGLNLGVRNFNFNFSDDIISDDPTIAALNKNSFQFSGQFGFYYNFNDLYIDFSLPQLFPANLSQSVGIDTQSFSPFDNYIISSHYDFRFENSKYKISPYIVYHQQARNSPSIDFIGLFDYKDLFWLGGGYRDNRGALITVGGRYKKISFSYGYESADQIVDKVGDGSHEIQLSLRIGKRKRSIPSTNHSNTEQNSIGRRLENRKDSTSLLEITMSQSTEFNSFDELSTGYYLVTGEFYDQTAANIFARELQDKGLSIQVGYYSAEGKYFVYIFNAYLKNTILEKYRNLKSSLDNTPHYLLHIE